MISRAVPTFSRTALMRTSVRGLSSKATESPSLIAADRSMALQKIFHQTSIACLALTPVAILAHPTPLSMPVDVLLSVAFPLHAHIGISWILSDYVQGATPNGPFRMAIFGLTCVASLGLLKLSVTGDGILGTVKAVWTGPKKEDK